MLSSQELIEKLENKGITFNLYSKNDATHFLSEHNYYTKLSAYRFNFIKHKNKYVGLDFFHLKELSTIDMHLRFIIIKICLNIEHSLKVNLLKDIENKKIDDFEISKKYTDKYNMAIEQINRVKDKNYTSKLIEKYPNENYPISVILEIISFGELVNFYKFYCQEYNYKSEHITLLYKVRNLRNASAHSNCLIHNLTDRTNHYDKEIVKTIKKLDPQLKESTIKNRLKNNTVQDFICLLLLLYDIVKSEDIKKSCFFELKDFFENRMIRNKNIFKSSTAIQQTYEFTKNILDKLINLM